MKYGISKSRYCSGLQCPKMLWMQKNKPEEFDQACMNESILEKGLEVGDLAMGLFGDYVEVAYGDKADMIEKTRELMDRGTPIIAEASFSADGLFCSVDILKNLGDNKVALYEVKSSSGVKEIYYHDVTFQCYVLEKLGYTVVSCGIVHINNKYVRRGELDIRKLFTVVDITPRVRMLLKDVTANIDRMRNCAEQESEPTDDIGTYCFEPYNCGFFAYCSKHLPKPNVLDVRGVNKSMAIEWYHKGIVSFEDLNTSDVLTAKQHMQIEHEITACPPRIDVKNIREYLKKMTYPIYFFDFESYQPAVPPFDNIGPFQQVVFQYSLDYIEYEGGPIHHRDFLAYPGVDPRRALAEQMCADIPKNVCVVTYNMRFEKTQIKGLEELYPDLSEHLLNIRDHVVDLMVPFQKRWYYCRAMQGSFSIKQVLPALFPDDPSLDYHNLEGIHQGGEAAAAFSRMAQMSPEELENTRQQLLTYCGLDTYAMIKIWDKLKEICSESI